VIHDQSLHWKVTGIAGHLAFLFRTSTV